ncbi:MAG: hypothetical protein HOV80_17015 [Polyangiaceae bacterium]|nr:hypothetical protein [Polyangiaceae bacterium]
MAKHRIIAIGGTGYLGSRAVEALRKVPGLEVVVASRRGETRIDLGDPSTFSVLDGADLVVDLADATTTRPDAVARYCLEKGLRFLETTSDQTVIDGMLRDLRGTEGPGSVILGAGIFTGLSNLMGARIAREGGTVRLGISTSPYSGAGKGTVALMAAALSTEAIAYKDDKRVIHPPTSKGPEIEFPGGRAPTLRVPFPEAVMIRTSTGAATVDVFFAPKPSLLVYAFLVMPAFLLRARWFARLMGAYFGFLRTKLLARSGTVSELVAEGDRGRVSLRANDGMHAGGVAIAAIIEALLEKPVAVKGCLTVDEVVSLGEIMKRFERLEPGLCTLQENYAENGRP